MDILLIGLVVFYLVHFIPSMPKLRQQLIQRTGIGVYKGVFSILALTSLGCVIIGMQQAKFVHVWSPPPEMHYLSAMMMLLGCWLLVSRFLPSVINRVTPHPMLWGVACWASAHLLSNGDLASLSLFGSFLCFSLLSIWSINQRGIQHAEASLSIRSTMLSFIAAMALFLALWKLHAYLGQPLLLGNL